ncbi:hypothetical protein [Winogradskyella aurantiaca]|uniref:hypothetical protein n=1 Tax=Winogradskyella aurantiaca TaxID=2219558 RepID=UPI000E1C7287|nr:hypothetical protein [Winogradskyella aurantiaca]
MKKQSLITLFLFVSFFNLLSAKQIDFTIKNRTEQIITTLEYWLGSATESLSPGLNFSSKGSLNIDGSKTIPINFHKKKRNTIIVRAYLKGGGFVRQKYTVSKGELTPSIDLMNIAERVPTDEFEKVKRKFTELKLDNGYVKSSELNGLNSVIGSIVIYNQEGKIISKIDPNVLGTKLSGTSLPDLKQTISGLFSSETAFDADVNLPFVSVSSAFGSGDVAKFVYEIEDVGQFTWSSENGTDLAELFFALPDQRKEALVQLYSDHPNAKMEFIDKAFVIGRLEIITQKTRKLDVSAEVNGSTFVTVNGNYNFIDDLKDEFVLNDVITEATGYDATNLLKTLYVQEMTKRANLQRQDEINQLREQYASLREQYPELLEETNNVNKMKKAIMDLSDNEEDKLIINKELQKINFDSKDEIRIQRGSGTF